MTAPATMLRTNVLSELMRAAANANVARFVATLATPLVSVAVFHELGYGVELLPEGARKARMQARIGGFKAHFEDCTIPIDVEIARLSGKTPRDRRTSRRRARADGSAGSRPAQ